jgi:predicted dehydrogenase
MLRLGLIGAGRIGRVYIEGARRSQEVELVAVADIERPSLAALRLEGVKTYASAAEMLRESDLEAVIIATPPASHFLIARQCIESGAHVLCEKPLTLSIAETEVAMEAAEKRGVTFTMATKFRFLPTVAHARDVIAAGEIGDVIAFENTFSSHADMSARWNVVEQISGGGVVADNLPHSADIVRYLLGPITDVFAARGRHVRGTAVEGDAYVLMKLASGALGVVQLSWSYDRGDDDFFSAYGSGCLKIGWNGMRYRTARESDWMGIRHEYDKADALRAQIDNFARVVRGLEPPEVTTEELLAGTRVVMAACRSLVTERWESI